MRTLATFAALVLGVLLAGCATAPAMPLPAAESLFHDELFNPPSQRIDAAEVFAMSDAMRRYIATDIAPQVRAKGKQRALLDALYRQGGLRLSYDATHTRNAAEAFEARSGNCLSLLVMTAAFAKELNLRVEFQSAILDEMWTRSGNLLLASSHVNITLGRRSVDTGNLHEFDTMVVDFLPADEIRGMRTRPITEETVVAMFMSNRAAESLLAGRLDDAYAWARGAIRQSPGFLSAYNTLGVVYMRHGNLPQAVAVFEQVLQREPENTRAMANLASAYTQQGRADAARALETRLARLDPHPPFHFFDIGMQAMKKGDFHLARSMFAREVARAEHQHEFHFWLSLASFKLGDIGEADRHLAQALEASQAPKDKDSYSAKLAWLRSMRHP